LADDGRHILTDKWYELGRGGSALGDQQHEDRERQQNGDTERHLLAGVGWQPEPGDGEQAEPEARTDDVEQVVEGTAPYHQAERHVRVRLLAARVQHLVALS